ncbi:MAG: hypothetical protein GF307_11470 [candidate division Zixibacteria bacterium]|nr:hypothetical protein [candidate division Zixibacteria bacterium]
MSPVEKAVLDGLNKGIQQELMAYVFYKKGIEVSQDEQLVEILEFLANEEKEHFRILEGQYDSLVRSEMWNTIADVLRKPGLPDIDERMAEIHEDFIDDVSESTSPKEILKIGLRLEEDAVKLYSGLVDKTEDPKGKETFQYLVKFEKGHAAKIRKILERFE